MSEPVPFEIVTHDVGRTASNGVASITLSEQDGQVFRRRAVRGVGTEGARKVEWAVVVLDGVHVYFDGTNVVVTRKDLTP